MHHKRFNCKTDKKWIRSRKYEIKQGNQVIFLCTLLESNEIKIIAQPSFVAHGTDRHLGVRNLWDKRFHLYLLFQRSTIINKYTSSLYTCMHTSDSGNCFRQSLSLGGPTPLPADFVTTKQLLRTNRLSSVITATCRSCSYTKNLLKVSSKVIIVSIVLYGP